MKNTKVENEKLRMKEQLGMSKTVTVGILGTATAALAVTAVFKKEARKAIVAGMVTGVATPFIAKAVASKIEKTALAQAIKADFEEKMEAKKAEMVADMLKEEEGSESSEDRESSKEVVEQEAVNTVSIKEFDEYKEAMEKTLSDFSDIMKILDQRTRSQKEETENFSKLLNDTVKDISKTYIGMSKEVKEINKEVKAMKKDEQATKAIKEYLDENRKVILEELGIKGSDLISCIDINKFSEQAAQATANEMAATVMGQVGEVITAAVRQEIKDTGLAKELDEVKAFILEMGETVEE